MPDPAATGLYSKLLEPYVFKLSLSLSSVFAALTTDPNYISSLFVILFIFR